VNIDNDIQKEKQKLDVIEDEKHILGFVSYYKNHIFYNHHLFYVIRF
jgi:hypothetical protein